MEIFKIENLSFTYPKREFKALEDINLTINSGDFVLFCGKSGCGKTTLLRLLKPAIAPFGNLSGDIYFNGKPINYCSSRVQASLIGFVMQNPNNQIVTDKVWHELAFGLESLGYKTDEIRRRVSEMASFFGIQNWFYKDTNTLSGGQKQLLNLASVMVMQPSVLILDEPTSQLDPIASGEFLNTLYKINRELGTTIILTEHRLEEAFELADKIFVMDEGKIIASESPKEIGAILKSINHPMYNALPTPIRVHGEVKSTLPTPVSIREGRFWLEEYSKENTLNASLIPKDKFNTEANKKVIEIKDAWFRYEKDLPDVLKGFNMVVHKGEFFCLTGGNGTGKTTALSLASGLNAPYRGSVYINGEKISKISNLYNGLLGVLPQNPQSLFVKNTVYLDLMDILSERVLTKDEKEKIISSIATLCKIENLLESHPYDLSGGEQQRVGLAKILLTEPEILILDEPTKGMDALYKEEFAHILKKLQEKGVTILMVSHDIEFCAEYADRCALVFDGAVTSTGTPREFFKGNSFYTTSANRMARTRLPDAILAHDIISACGCTIKKKEIPPYNFDFPKKGVPVKENQKTEPRKSKKKPSKRTVLSIFLILFLIPLTIYMGFSFLGDRKYYFTSLLIMIESILPFCLMFESRKPKAKELIVISVLCAIAVAGRATFFMLPQFKPVVAIVIIAGVCFGGETGFLVGAVTGLVSNFFFGQGPWTPWQMFAFGIIGFVSGLIFNKNVHKKRKILLCVFGFSATYIIYGGIMNPASVIMWQNTITWEMLLSSYVTAFSFDIVHSLSTAFFLWFISDVIIEKIERIKIKYGFI